jgi:peptidoglycan/LPS O-acetylase OafA/YrhL
MSVDRIDREKGAAEERPWWRTPLGIGTCGFLIVAGFFLLTEHTAHVFGVLPFLLLAACPLMHLFMHHGHHGGHDQTPRPHPDDGREARP